MSIFIYFRLIDINSDNITWEMALSKCTFDYYNKEFLNKVFYIIGFDNNTYPKLYYIERGIKMLGGIVIHNNNIMDYDYIIYNDNSDLLYNLYF